MRIRILAVALASPAPGCASAGAYWKSRALDLWDIVPIAVQFDVGLAASARITPFVQTGLGVYGVDADSANSWGMGLGRWGPAWRETAVHVLLCSMEESSIEGRPWRRGPDTRYRMRHEENFVRRSGNLFVVLPFSSFDDLPMPLYGWAQSKLPPWYGYLDCEAQVFLGLAGIRVGLAPLQLPDFLLGFLGIDFVGDDPTSGEAAPDPALTPPPDPSTE